MTASATDSFERPCLVRRPQGGWRLYVCCATPGSKHWWIEAIDADDPSGLPAGDRTVVFPGSDALAVKDPIVDVNGAGAWRAWICCHPLTEPGEEDRMTTAYATSVDGLSWDWHGDVLRPTPGTWDQRGARMTTILSSEPLVVLYDGRASAEDNWFEQTGIATGARRSSRRRPGRSRPRRRRTRTARCATPPRCRCPTGAPGSTSRRPAPTGRTTSGPASALRAV